MASVIRGSGTSSLGGDLDIEGVLTYEDVASVDSIGIITARSGIEVTGHTETDTLNVSGISTAGSLVVDGNVSSTTQFSGFDGLRIHNNNGAAFGVTADMYFTAGTASNNRGAAIGVEYNSSTQGNDLYFATNGSAITSNDTLSERLRITSAGRMGLGCTPDTTADFHIRNSNAANLKLGGSGTDATGFSIDYTNSGTTTTTIKQHYRATSVNATTHIDTGTFTLATGDSNEERLRITSDGSLLVGTTSDSLTIQGFQVAGGQIKVVRGTNGDFAKFYATGTGTQIGSIRNIGGTTTDYIETSDYRLKENVVDITDGITRLKQLRPRRFNFIVDPDNTIDGFIAHEAQPVVPQAVCGTKDEVDENNDPVLQGIDKSKLVPLLTAALQEAITKIESLEARITALEGF